MTSRGHLKFGAVLIAIMAVAAAAAPARADVTCSVVEIEASMGTKPSVDGELRQFEKRFKRPPYSSWNTFKRLGGTTATLAPQSESDVQLVHGKVGMLLRDVIERSGKRARLSIGVTLDDSAGKRVVDTKINVDAGDWFMWARPMPGDKGHLVALSCK